MHGVIVSLSSPEICELMAMAGFDWLFIDSEHAPLSFADVQKMLQGAGDCPCLVRVALNDEVLIKKALDLGPAGLIIPQVNSAEAAARVVRFSRYPPAGARSVGVARAQGYGLKFGDYIEQANDAVSIVIQIEHIDAVNNIESIVQVEGIDGFFIGPYDLSTSMGKPGAVDDPEVQQAIDTVCACCSKASKPLGIFGINAEAVKSYQEPDYSLIAVGVDVMLLGSTAKDIVAALRS